MNQKVIVSYMVVRIDISNLPSHLRNALMNEIGFKNRSKSVPSSNKSEINDVDKNESKSSSGTYEVRLVEENNNHTTYQKIKDTLLKNRIGDYVAIKHHKEEDVVVILKRIEAERQGIYHCRLCGMEFDDSVS
jgi:rubrerythrin